MKFKVIACVCILLAAFFIRSEELISSISKAKSPVLFKEVIVKKYRDNHEQPKKLKAFSETREHALKNSIQILIPKELNIREQLEQGSFSLKTKTFIKDKLYQLYNEFGPEFLNDIFLMIVKEGAEKFRTTKIFYICAMLNAVLNIFKEFIEENHIPVTYFETSLDAFNIFLKTKIPKNEN